MLQRNLVDKPHRFFLDIASTVEIIEKCSNRRNGVEFAWELKHIFYMSPCTYVRKKYKGYSIAFCLLSPVYIHLGNTVMEF